VHYVNAVVNSIGSKQLDWDILGEIAGMRDWNNVMRDSDIARRVEAERLANEPEFHAYIQDYMARNPGRGS
jgi:glutathione S-transferase